MTMIETKKLRKVFGPIEAVKGVSFLVEKGEVLAFLGPNGAGKSTVMRMLTCFLPPTAGTATIGGHDIQTDSLEARRMIGYLPESNPLYTDMTSLSFLQFAGEMRGFHGAELQKRIERVIDACQLGGVRHQVIDTLSKGFQRRVGLAQALIHDPPILILDEPTDGLDPNQKLEVHTLIRQMAPEKAIVISTHILDEVDSVCSRAIIIAEGRIVADGSPDELKRRSRLHGAVRLGIIGGGEECAKALGEIEGVKDLEQIDSEDGVARYTLFPQEGKNIAHRIAELAGRHQWQIEELHVETGSLTEVFRDITTKESQQS